jgi:hypothetical protein
MAGRSTNGIPAGKNKFDVGTVGQWQQVVCLGVGWCHAGVADTGVVAALAAMVIMVGCGLVPDSVRPDHQVVSLVKGFLKKHSFKVTQCILEICNH